MKSAVKKFSPALLTGTALAFAFPALNLYLLAWVALLPLLIRIDKAPPRRLCAHFFLAGWCFYTLTWNWLFANVNWAGGWAIFGQQALCLYMASYWALIGLSWNWMRQRLPAFAGPMVLATLWVGMEHLQGLLFTGFGTGALAHTQGPDLILLQWAAVGGASLVSFILVWVNALAAQLFLHRRTRLRSAAAVLGIVLLSHVGGYFLLAEPDITTKPFRVAMVQPNFSVEMKWDPEYTVEMMRNVVAKSRNLLNHEDADLLIWPEGQVMTSIDQPYIKNMLTTFARESGTPIFTGSVRRADNPARSYNSSYLLDEAGEIVDYYDKIHLAPFGEYVPLAKLLPFVHRVLPAIGSAASGTEPKVLSTGEHRFGPLICFEVMFPAMAERLRRDGAESLIVVTNLNWFGASSAIPQELAVARMRAIETRLPLIHCANTGVSGVFDPWGRFTVIRGRADDGNNYLPGPTDAKPMSAMRRRMVGVFDVAAPGTRPLPWGPVVFPWMALGVSLALLAISTRLKKGSATSKAS